MEKKINFSAPSIFPNGINLMDKFNNGINTYNSTIKKTISEENTSKHINFSKFLKKNNNVPLLSLIPKNPIIMKKPNIPLTSNIHSGESINIMINNVKKLYPYALTDEQVAEKISEKLNGTNYEEISKN